MRTIRAITTFAFCLIVTSLLLVSAALAGSDKDANQSGQAEFKGNCVACHGADGAGTPLGKSLQAADLRSPEVQKKSDEELSKAVAEGKGNMPSFKRVLNADQIQAVVKYVRQLGTARK